MGCIITVAVFDTEKENPVKRIELAEDFQEVFDRVFPVQPPNSQESFRDKCLFKTETGHWYAVAVGLVLDIEEM